MSCNYIFVFAIRSANVAFQAEKGCSRFFSQIVRTVKLLAVLTHLDKLVRPTTAKVYTFGSSAHLIFSVVQLAPMNFQLLFPVELRTERKRRRLRW